MLKKSNFFEGYFGNSSKYYKNLKQTKRIFNSLIIDLKNCDIPLLESYKKEYQFDFSTTLVKKFSKYKNIVIIGVGGSILGAKSIYSFLKKKIKKEVFFFDNLDSNLHLSFEKQKNFRNSCFVIVSKSGNTLETIVNLSTILSKTLLKKRLIIITEIKNNNLMVIANKYSAEIIEHKEFISGRYSVLSEPGMFPAALMGLNVKKFKNLKALMRNKNFVSILVQNVAGIYTLFTQGIINSVILNYDSNLNDLGYWYQQLIAESLGKNGKGFNPTMSLNPKDHHSLLQLYLDGPKDKFFTFFNSTKSENKFKVTGEIIPSDMMFLKNKNLEFITNAQCNATKNIFKLKKIPFRQITFNKKDENELGEIFTFFVLETILLSRLMNIDPFNQPAVEQVKIETKKFLR